MPGADGVGEPVAAGAVGAALTRRSVMDTLVGLPPVITGVATSLVRTSLPSTRIRARTTYRWLADDFRRVVREDECDRRVAGGLHARRRDHRRGRVGPRNVFDRGLEDRSGGQGHALAIRRRAVDPLGDGRSRHQPEGHDQSGARKNHDSARASLPLGTAPDRPNGPILLLHAQCRH